MGVGGGRRPQVTIVLSLRLADYKASCALRQFSYKPGHAVCAVVDSNGTNQRASREWPCCVRWQRIQTPRGGEFVEVGEP